MELGFLMLTDHSEAVNGKLYMTGGGWNVLRFPELPHDWTFGIALGIDVAWDETNRSHELLLKIEDPDGLQLGEASRATSKPAGPPACPPARNSGW